MDIKQFIILAGVFIALMFVYKITGRLIKNMEPKTMKIINWSAFVLALLSGIAWYLLDDGIFMILMVLGVVVYFLFYDYDTKKTEKHDGGGTTHVER